MKWKVISMENSVLARRLALMLGLEMSRKPEGKFDGFIIFSVTPWNLTNMSRFRQVPKILYWTGTDAKMFLESNAKVDFGESIHMTDSPWLISKLFKKLPSVYFLPLPPYLPVPDVELKNPFGVLIYITKHVARDVERTKAFIREIPDVPVYILKGRGTGIIDRTFQSNVKDFEWISEEAKREIFKKCPVYVRLMNFDGLSQMVVEAKSLGRHVFYTNPAPFCDFVKPEESPKDIAKRVMEKMEAPLDTDGASWYKSVFSKENFLKTITPLCASKGWDFPYA